MSWTVPIALGVLVVLFVVVALLRHHLNKRKGTGYGLGITVVGFIAGALVYVFLVPPPGTQKPKSADTDGVGVPEIVKKGPIVVQAAVDPTYQFWTPDENTCKDAARPSHWCLKDGDIEKIEEWLASLPTGWSRWHVWSRSSDDSSEVKPGYMWRFTDPGGERTTRLAIAYELATIFGYKESSPYIYVEVIRHPHDAPLFVVTFDEVNTWAAEHDKKPIASQ